MYSTTAKIRSARVAEQWAAALIAAFAGSGDARVPLAVLAVAAASCAAALIPFRGT